MKPRATRAALSRRVLPSVRRPAVRESSLQSRMTSISGCLFVVCPMLSSQGRNDCGTGSPNGGDGRSDRLVAAPFTHEVHWPASGGIHGLATHVLAAFPFPIQSSPGHRRPRPARNARGPRRLLGEPAVSGTAARGHDLRRYASYLGRGLEWSLPHRDRPRSGVEQLLLGDAGGQVLEPHADPAA